MAEEEKRGAEQGELEEHIDWLYYPAVGAVEGGGTEKVKEIKEGLGFIGKLMYWWHWLLTGEWYNQETAKGGSDNEFTRED